MADNHQVTPPPRTNLPVVRHLLNAYFQWQEFLNHFPKKNRYTLGAKIETYFLETLEAIFLASVHPRERRIPYIERAVVKFDALKFFLQIAWEGKTLDTNKYVALSKPLEEIGKMLGGWLRNAMTQTPAQGGREK